MISVLKYLLMNKTLYTSSKPSIHKVPSMYKGKRKMLKLLLRQLQLMKHCFSTKKSHIYLYSFTQKIFHYIPGNHKKEFVLARKLKGKEVFTNLSLKYVLPHFLQGVNIFVRILFNYSPTSHTIPSFLLAGRDHHAI